MMSLDHNRKIARPRLQHVLAFLVAALCLFSNGPSRAISGRLGDLSPLTQDETDNWIKLLQLEKDENVRIKGMNALLLDVPVSIIRVESSSCVDDLCLTFFRYEMGQVFQIGIYCTQKIVGMDRIVTDPNGKHLFSIAVETGENQTTLLTPSSLGPIMAVVRPNHP